MGKILLLVTTLISLTWQSAHAANGGRNLTVFAEPNLALALTKIVRIYSQKSNTIVSVNFSSTSDLISEIDSGEPADVFISAHPQWIESLRQKGLVDVYNIGYIAHDKLMLVTSKTNTAPITKLTLEEALRRLDDNKSSLIIDNEGSSSGFFAKNFLTPLALKNIKLFSKLPEDHTPVVNSIKSANKDYALLLNSQLDKEPNLQIIASGKSDRIFYQALVIAGDNMELAREFLKFLKSHDAKAILKESGFLTD